MIYKQSKKFKAEIYRKNINVSYINYIFFSPNWLHRILNIISP